MIPLVSANVIHVPGEQPTIQAGIDAAISGDTVLVADGIYTGPGNRNIAFNYRLITVKSSTGPPNTIIDCQGLGRAFNITDNEDSTASITGFTIRNGDGDVGGGGGVRIFGGAQPLIQDCVFEDCTASRGGGLYIAGADIHWIQNCIFRNNNATEDGGGAYYENEGHNMHLVNCLFDGNSAQNGGAIMAWDNTRIVIDNCTFINNSATNRGAVSFQYALEFVTFRRCILAYNLGPAPIWCDGTCGTAFYCTNIYGNLDGDWGTNSCIVEQQYINGNFSLDPLFCDTTIGDYTILANSPCAPENNSCSTLIGAYGVGCWEPPSVQAFKIVNEDFTNVVSHTPEFSWEYYSPVPNPEDSFEVAVGIDNDWQYAEMWNPAPFPGPDTSIVYGGANLIDSETYYLRLRVNNGLAWSEWYETSFRMNSIPTIPVQTYPVDYEVVNDGQPTLWIQNSTDAEGDDLFYDFTVLVDCVLVVGDNIPQQVDSTGWQVDTPFEDNLLHLWYARAYDGYEYSDWTDWEYFWVNAAEEYPTAFDLQYPPDTGWSQVHEFPATFQWSISTDPDPMDSVYYRLIVSIDSNFTFTAIHDSIFQDSSDLPVLDFGTHYWWKVYAIDTKGNETQGNNVADFLTWVLGDANQDGSTDVGDAVFLINTIFKGGPLPNPFKCGDANGDCCTNVGDVVYLINFVFKGGPAPPVGCDDCPDD
jgi:hypothetical protein